MKKLSLFLILGLIFNNTTVHTAENQDGYTKRVWNVVKPKSVSWKTSKRALAFVATGGAFAYLLKDRTETFLGHTTSEFAKAIGVNLALAGVSKFWIPETDYDPETVCAVSTEAVTALTKQIILTPCFISLLPLFTNAYIGKIPAPLAVSAVYGGARSILSIPEVENQLPETITPHLPKIFALLDDLAETTIEGAFWNYLSPSPAFGGPRRMISSFDATKKFGLYLTLQCGTEILIKELNKREQENRKADLKNMEKVQNKILEEDFNYKYAEISFLNKNYVYAYYDSAIEWLKNSSLENKQDLINQLEYKRKNIEKTSCGFKCSFLVEHIKQNKNKWAVKVIETENKYLITQTIASVKKELISRILTSQILPQKSALAACPFIFNRFGGDLCAGAVATIPHRMIQSVKTAAINEFFNPTKIEDVD